MPSSSSPQRADVTPMLAHLNEFQRQIVLRKINALDLNHIYDTFKRVRHLTTLQDVLNALVETYNRTVVDPTSSPMLVAYYLYAYLHVLCNKPQSHDCDQSKTDLYANYDKQIFNTANEREFTVKIKCNSGGNKMLFEHYEDQMADARSRKVYRMKEISVFAAISIYPRLVHVYDPATAFAITDVRVRETRTGDRIEYGAKVFLLKDTVRRARTLNESVKLSVEVALFTDPPADVENYLLFSRHLVADPPETEKTTQFKYLDDEATIRLSLDRVRHAHKSGESNIIALEFEDPNVRLLDVYRHVGKVLRLP